MKLIEAILKIINEKSGGCKITELSAEIVALIIQGKIDDYTCEMLDAAKDFPLFLENTVKSMPQLRTLDYLWSECNRIKTFVYTPPHAWF